MSKRPVPTKRTAILMSPSWPAVIVFLAGGYLVLKVLEHPTLSKSNWGLGIILFFTYCVCNGVSARDAANAIAEFVSRVKGATMGPQNPTLPGAEESNDNDRE